jgi:transcriptional regulator with XRE-family HTH domain
MASSKDLKTQTALAKKSGVAQSTIGRILRGEVDPQSGNLERIANAFSMSLAKLAEMGEEDEPVAEPIEDALNIDPIALLRRILQW